MTPHTHIPSVEIEPEIDASPLMITIVEEAINGNNAQPVKAFQERLKIFEEDELHMLEKYIQGTHYKCIQHECVKEVEKAKTRKDFSLIVIDECIARRDAKLQIAMLLRSIVHEAFIVSGDKRMEAARNRSIQLRTSGVITGHEITSLSRAEISDIMREPKKENETVH